MLTVSEIISSRKKKQRKPDELELRRLPDRKAIVHGRLSRFDQVKDSIESVREIAAQVERAKADGYKTRLDGNTVQLWLEKIQAGIIPAGLLEDGEVIVNCLGLGISGTLPEDKRPDIQLDMDYIAKGEAGAIYVTEGANRLSRDTDRVVSAVLLKAMKETNCKLRTPIEVLSPCIERDWEIIHEEFERAADEMKTMNRRLSFRRRSKAARGEFAGEPVIPGFIVTVVGTRSNGSRVYGKYEPYPPHIDIVIKALREYVKQGGSKYKAHHALGEQEFPFFPPQLEYMERLTALRKAKKTAGGYLLSPAMIRSLADNLRLIGISTWGDTEPRISNHEAIVPEDLFLKAHELALRSGKPRGRSVRNEPLEWDHLLWCYNHDIPSRILGNTAKEAYHCQSEYVQGRGPACLHMSALYLGEPLTKAVLGLLSFTPLAEEVLMQLEADYSNLSLEAEQTKRKIAEWGKRLENLEQQLGWEGGEHDRILLRQIQKTQYELEELKSRPVPTRSVSEISYPMVRDFLVGLPGRWHSYSRALRNRLLKSLIDRVEIRHEWPLVEATICWRTGQKQVVEIRRVRAKRNQESFWSDEEKNILKMLWPNALQTTIMAAIPGRTWLAIRHQAQNMSLKRTLATYRCVTRGRWSPEDDRRAQQNYELGIPIDKISAELQRSCSAIMQRASDKGWKRPHTKAGGEADSFSTIRQRPTVPNGVCSGLVFEGQVTIPRYLKPKSGYHNIYLTLLIHKFKHKSVATIKRGFSLSENPAITSVTAKG